MPPALTDKSTRAVAIVLLACAAGMALRIGLATRGHNYDMDSWRMTADLVVEGRNVYANTFRHPYGPTWFLLLGGLRWIHDTLGVARLGPESFHILIAAFLSLADVGIALLLFRFFGMVAALLFILNPVSILLTGYHSQIDNLAILPGLAAWLMIRSSISWRSLAGSAALLALSLSIKHVLIFFPIWLLMCAQLGSFPRRFVHACLTFGLLALIVLPFIRAPGAWTGFYRDVIVYDAPANHTLLAHLIDLFMPPQAFDTFFGLGANVMLRRAFFVGMIWMGWIVARRRHDELFWCYLLSIVVLTYSMADQYLAIPLVACAVYWRCWPAWVYVIPATLLVYFASAQAGALPQPGRWEPYLSNLSYQHAQIWLGVLLVLVLRRGRDHGRSSQSSPS
jgi:hypothetical protein